MSKEAPLADVASKYLEDTHPSVNLLNGALMYLHDMTWGPFVAHLLIGGARIVETRPLNEKVAIYLPRRRTPTMIPSMREPQETLVKRDLQKRWPSREHARGSISLDPLVIELADNQVQDVMGMYEQLKQEAQTSTTVTCKTFTNASVFLGKKFGTVTQGTNTWHIKPMLAFEFTDTGSVLVKLQKWDSPEDVGIIYK